MNTHVITRAAYGCILLCLFTLPVFAQSNDTIDEAKATFQDIFMTEMSKAARQFPIPINRPCKSATWDDGLALIASVEGVEDLSPPEVFDGNDLMFVYLSEKETGQGSALPNGFYAVSLRKQLDTDDGSIWDYAQFRDAAGNTVAEAPAEVSRMPMEGATPGVDVAVEHSEGVVRLSLHIIWSRARSEAPASASGGAVWIIFNTNDAKAVAAPSRMKAEPSGVVLHEGYPNPFNPTTTLSFTLPEAMPVTLRVYDLVGREVATLVSGVREAGTHEVPFDASHLASGTYLYRLEAGTFSQTKRFALVK